LPTLVALLALFEAFVARIYADAKARREFLADPPGEAVQAVLSPRRYER
jgi:hypothetical protein